MDQIPIVDSHVHFWDPGRLDYDWLESARTLNKPFLLPNYNDAIKDIKIDKMVFVECNCKTTMNEEEVKWITKMAEEDQRIQAIVAFADLTDTSNIDASLERLSDYELVRGFRHNIQSMPPGFALQPTFIEGVKKIFLLNKHFELCITYDQLAECNNLIDALPESPLILNHCAKPNIKDGEINIWKKQLKKLSENQNLYCKLSGLLTEANHQSWQPKEIIPYLDHARDCFGSKRIVFGSDWPVCTLAGGYQSWFDLISAWTGSWTNSEQSDFYCNNASRFYLLDK